MERGGLVCLNGRGGAAAVVEADKKKKKKKPATVKHTPKFIYIYSSTGKRLDHPLPDPPVITDYFKRRRETGDDDALPTTAEPPLSSTDHSLPATGG